MQDPMRRQTSLHLCVESLTVVLCEKHVDLEAPLQLLMSYHTVVNITVIVSKSAITWPEVHAAHVNDRWTNRAVVCCHQCLHHHFTFGPPPDPCFLSSSTSLLSVVEWLQLEGNCLDHEHHSCVTPFFSRHQLLLLDPVLNSPHAALFNQAVTRFGCYCLLAFTWQPSP